MPSLTGKLNINDLPCISVLIWQFLNCFFYLLKISCLTDNVQQLLDFINFGNKTSLTCTANSLLFTQ